MEPAKILTADWLDLLFENRNKSYGAYILRKEYSKHLTIAVLLTFVVFGLLLFSQKWFSQTEELPPKPIVTIVDLIALPDEKKVEPKKPEKTIQPPQTATEKHVDYQIVDDNQVDELPPTNDDLKVADIGLFKSDGVVPTNIQSPPLPVAPLAEEIKKPEAPAIEKTVDVEAVFEGDWTKFLQRNLNAEIPINNGASPGRHRVVIQFVVDTDGSISQLKPISNVGFGMEAEALRVLQKAKKWQPAQKNGNAVKAYRQQVIIFEVLP